MPLLSARSNSESLVQKSVALPTEPNLTQFNGFLAYNHVLYAFMWTNSSTFRLVKTYFVAPKDRAFISSKQISIDADTAELSACKNANGWADCFSAFYSRLASVPVLSCR